MRTAHGFTLMEILIVIVILGVLAGIAVPVYTANVEKSRQTEALASLDATRQSMLRFFQANGTYVGSTLGPANIDFDPNTAVGGQTLHFVYTLVPAPTAAAFTIVATRNGVENPTAAVGTVSIDQAGVVAKTGVYIG